MSPGCPTHFPTFQYRKPVIFPRRAFSSLISCLLPKEVFFCFYFSVNPHVLLSFLSKYQLIHEPVSILASGCKTELLGETRPTMCARACAYTDVLRCSHHWELNAGVPHSMKLHLSWAGWPKSACTHCSSFISDAMIKYPGKSNTGGKGLFGLWSQATVYHFGEVKAGTQVVHHIHNKSKEYKPVLPCCFRSASSLHSSSSGPSPWNSTTRIQGGAPNTVSNQDNPPTDMYIGQYNPDNPQVKCWRQFLCVKLEIKANHHTSSTWWTSLSCSASTFLITLNLPEDRTMVSLQSMPRI